MKTFFDCCSFSLKKMDRFHREDPEPVFKTGHFEDFDILNLNIVLKRIVNNFRNPLVDKQRKLAKMFVF